MGVLIESVELATNFIESVSAALPDTAWQVRLNDKTEVEWVESDNGKEIIYTKAPQTSAWRRFSARISNLDTLEGQL